jgi:multisubunit Na+/H+ antiporter MnhB subunit
MKRITRIIAFICILGLSYFAFMQEYKDDHIFMQVDYVPFAFLVIITFAVLLLDISFYRIKKNSYQFISSMISLLLCSLVLIKIYLSHAMVQ